MSSVFERGSRKEYCVPGVRACSWNDIKGGPVKAMKIEFLGAHTTETRSTRLSSLLIDDVLALDAGGLTSSLSLAEQLK